MKINPPSKETIQIGKELLDLVFQGIQAFGLLSRGSSNFSSLLNFGNKVKESSAEKHKDSDKEFSLLDSLGSIDEATFLQAIALIGEFLDSERKGRDKGKGAPMSGHEFTKFIMDLYRILPDHEKSQLRFILIIKKTEVGSLEPDTDGKPTRKIRIHNFDEHDPRTKTFCMLAKMVRHYGAEQTAQHLRDLGLLKPTIVQDFGKFMVNLAANTGYTAWHQEMSQLSGWELFLRNPLMKPLIAVILVITIYELIKFPWIAFGLAIFGLLATVLIKFLNNRKGV
jgi:hypothetical protein